MLLSMCPPGHYLDSVCVAVVRHSKQYLTPVEAYQVFAKGELRPWRIMVEEKVTEQAFAWYLKRARLLTKLFEQYRAIKPPEGSGTTNEAKVVDEEPTAENGSRVLDLRLVWAARVVAVRVHP